MKRLCRITALFLCLVLATGLCACKEEKKSTSKNKPNQSDNSDDTGDVGNTDNGGNNGNGSSDFWENEEGLTVPPLTAPDETAEEVADEFVTALQAGDWETVNQRILSYAIMGSGTDGIMSGGIMEKIMNTMSTKIQKVTDNGDGTYSVSVTVEAIDYKALVEALPEKVYSADEARQEMLRLADSADRKTFTGEFTVLRYSNTGAYFIEPEISFINAITGGYYDLYVEIMEGVMEQ